MRTLSHPRSAATTRPLAPWRFAVLLSASLLSASLLTTPASAQLQQLGLYPEVTQFTSRSALSISSEGELLVHFPRNVLVGAGNPGGEIQGLRAVVQDQDLATRDPVQLVVLASDGANGPDTTAGNELLRSEDLLLPDGSGLGAAVMTIALTTPLALPADDYYVGVALGTALDWPRDGASVHGCNYSGPANVDDPEVPGLVTTHDRTTSRLIAGQRRVHAVHVLTTGVALRIGADVDPAARRGGPNPDFGVRGAFQDRGSDDGLAIRVEDSSRPGRDVVVLGQLGGATVPYQVPGLDGLLYLNPALVFPDLLAAGLTDPQGRFETVALAWPLRIPAPFQLISAQAIVDPLGSARVSNLAGIRD